MSRIGQRPILVPQGVEVRFDGNEVTAKGPKGELSRRFHPDITITLKDTNILVSRPTDSRSHRSLHGLTRSLLANMVQGVAKGFEKSLELGGVGYRATQSGEKLVLRVGYTHPVEISPPPGISFATEGPNRIIIQGIDKELVGEIAAQIRAVRPQDPYRGKGIKYADEEVRRKPGKAGGVGKKG